VRRAAGLVALALLVAGAGVGQALTPDEQHVLLVGDSIMRQTGSALDRQLGDGWAVHNEGVNGSGLLTPGFFDWPDHLEQDLARTDPDVVVFLFIGNYTDEPGQFWRTPEGEEIRDIGSAAFAEAWGREADAAMATIAETDARVVLVLPPPMPGDALQGVVDALRAEYLRVAEQWDFVRLADAAEPLGGPDGEWIGHKRTVGGDVLPVRVSDGVHLAPLGKRLLAQELVPAVRAQAS
jgi:hypothetical protein